MVSSKQNKATKMQTYVQGLAASIWPWVGVSKMKWCEASPAAENTLLPGPGLAGQMEQKDFWTSPLSEPRSKVG